MSRALLILDRDGVLNRLIDNPAEPRPDSPMSVGQVAIFPWVPAILRDLTAAGFALAVASNQPGAAKGKASRQALEAVHAAVLAGATALGGAIASSHVCFHRAEDGCACRKPGTGMLLEALARNPDCPKSLAWMVGDRVTDVLAGAAVGVRTALLGTPPAEDLALLAARGVRPSFQGDDLRDFAQFLRAKHATHE